MGRSPRAAGAPGRRLPGDAGFASRRALSGHLDRGSDSVLETVRVVGRGLGSIAKVYAIVAGAHLAERDVEMARDRFGFLERHRRPAAVESARGRVIGWAPRRTARLDGMRRLALRSVPAVDVMAGRAFAMAARRCAQGDASRACEPH